MEEDASEQQLDDHVGQMITEEMRGQPSSREETRARPCPFLLRDTATARVKTDRIHSHTYRDTWLILARGCVRERVDEIRPSP